MRSIPYFPLSANPSSPFPADSRSPSPLLDSPPLASAPPTAPFPAVPTLALPSAPGFAKWGPRFWHWVRWALSPSLRRSGLSGSCANWKRVPSLSPDWGVPGWSRAPPCSRCHRDGPSLPRWTASSATFCWVCGCCRCCSCRARSCSSHRSWVAGGTPPVKGCLSVRLCLCGKCRVLQGEGERGSSGRWIGWWCCQSSCFLQI